MSFSELTLMLIQGGSPEQHRAHRSICPLWVPGIGKFSLLILAENEKEEQNDGSF